MNTSINLQSSIKCICQVIIGNEESNDLIQCLGCRTSQHIKCIKKAVDMDLYLCPSCQIEKSDPFIKPINTLLHPVLLKEGYASSFDFNVSTSSSSSIILIRCFDLNSDSFAINWPEYCIVSLNNKAIESFYRFISFTTSIKHYQPIVFWNSEQLNQKINKDSYIKPSKETVLQIKNFFMESTTNRLTLNVNWSKNIPQSSYVISIDEVEVMNSVNEIIRNVLIVSNGEYVKRLRMKKNLLKTQETVNFIDVYSGNERIGFPARGLNCTHLSVFDLRSYLLFSKKTKRNLCPICNKSAYIFYIDEKMKIVINERNEVDSLLLDLDLNEEKSSMDNPYVDTFALNGRKDEKENNNEDEDIEMIDINSPLFSTNKI